MRLTNIEERAMLISTLFKAERDEIIKEADRVKSRSFMFQQRWDMEKTYFPVKFDGDIDFLYQPKDDPEWVYAFNRLSHFLLLAYAYYFTQDESYMDELIYQAERWIKTVKCDPSSLAWRTIETGIRLDVLSKTYLFLDSYNKFDKIRALYLDSIKEHTSLILSRSFDSYHLMSNWGVLSNHGLYIAGIVFENKEWEKEALRRLKLQLENQVYDDGTDWEQSPMYHNEVLRDYLDLLLFSRFGSIKLDDKSIDRIYKMAYVNLKWMKPNQCEPMMGDSDDINLSDVLSVSAYAFKDNYLKYVARRAADPYLIWYLGASCVKEYDDIIPLEPKETFYFLKDSGNSFDRTSFSPDADYIRMHTGTLGAGHGHADQTHISFVRKGKDYLVDGGRYTYVFNRGREEFKDQEMHNIVIRKGHRMYEEADSWLCKTLSRSINVRATSRDNITAFEGGHLAFWKDGIFINRRVVWFKAEALLLICDEIYGKENEEYSSLLHFSEDLRVDSIENNKVTISDSSTILALSNSDLTIEKKPSKISRHYNLQTESEALSINVKSKQFTSIYTLIDFESKVTSFNKVEVKSNFKSILFKDEQIEALSIKSDDKELVAIISHEEWASPTDTFLAAGCTGFGNLVIFDKSKREIIGNRLFC